MSEDEEFKPGESQRIVSKKEIKEREKELREEKQKEGVGVKEKPKDLSYVSLRHIDKVYDNNVQAVYDFTLDIKQHEFIVFVGPSGCGKSTTLRMIAGLEDISNGELYIDGEYANDLTPKDRDIAMVFQSYALYPHMTVYDNMAFGLKIRHLPKEEIDRRVHDAAKILQIEEFLDRKPKALSGGQRQRVALGRAIVRNAKVFLMDEPLSNLDAKLRVQMRSEIIKLTKTIGATTIYVTHDQTEAMTMASRIVVMKLGYIQQIGSPIEIYNHPSNMFVAGFIGSPAMNFIKGIYDKGVVTLPSEDKITLPPEFKAANEAFYKAQVAEDDKKLAELKDKAAALPNDEKLAQKIKELEDRRELDASGIDKPHEVVFGIRPEDITEQEKGFALKVAVAELLGHEYYVHADYAGIDLISKIPLSHEIKIGDPITLGFNVKKAHLFDPTSEKCIL